MAAYFIYFYILNKIMLINYFVLVVSVSIIALIWRALLLDHKLLLKYVRNLPIIGGALACGFCFTMWLALAAVVIYNPISDLFNELHGLINILLSWFVTSAGVLFFRNLLAILMEANGVLTDMHRSLHKKEEE
jgi:hypothetical protein